MVLLFSLVIAGCVYTLDGMTLFIEQFHSPHTEPRKNGASPRFLILHYSGCSLEKMHGCFMGTMHDDTVGRVSAHYLVLENGNIHQYVHENMRAWHAGQSYWAGETDLNSTSIGVEMVNMGELDGFPPFTDAQIKATIQLCQDILHRHPAITPFNVLGHSDIAPGRKPDPGPQMPWQRFADAGVGVMPPSSIPSQSSPSDPARESALSIRKPPSAAGRGSIDPHARTDGSSGQARGPRATGYLEINNLLTAIGYNPDVPLDTKMRAFCEHYAPEGLSEAGFAAAHFKLWKLAAMKATYKNTA